MSQSTTTPAVTRKSVGSILLGDVVRLANNRAKGDNAWHTVTRLHAGRDARTGKPATTLWTESGELGTFLYPVRFEVQQPSTASESEQAGARAFNLAAAEAQRANVATQLDAAQAKHMPEMPRRTATRVRVEPTVDDRAKTAQHHAETRAYLAKQAAEDLAARTCPSCERVFKSAKLLASHRATELTRDAAMKAAEATKAANAATKAAAKPAKAAKVAKVAKPAGERAPRPARASSALLTALGNLDVASGRALTRRELHADPMVVKALETRGWATVDRTGKERGLDLIELTETGHVRANQPV